MGKLMYRLAAFDPKTGRKVALHEIPSDVLRVAQKNAGFPHPFHDFAGEKPLTVGQALSIAELIGVQVNKHWKFYLSPVAIGGSVRVAHA